MLPSLSSRICNAIKSVNPIFRKQLKKLILDGRVWGTLSAEHFSYIQNLLPNCSLEGELAPDDCKDLKVGSINTFFKINGQVIIFIYYCYTAITG